MFNLNMLSNIYNSAIDENSKAVAFTINIGAGIFTFMIFLSKEDIKENDNLFIHLGRTDGFLEFKMFGSHRKGVFTIYPNRRDEQRIRDELGIQNGQMHPFVLDDFLTNLNAMIPQEIDNSRTADTLRESANVIKKHLPRVVDDVLRTHLIGIRTLQDGANAQDETLRKLYLYSDGDGDDISAFITAIKSDGRYTIAWREDGDSLPFSELLRDFRDRVRGVKR